MNSIPVLKHGGYVSDQPKRHLSKEKKEEFAAQLFEMYNYCHKHNIDFSVICEMEKSALSKLVWEISHNGELVLHRT